MRRPAERHAAAADALPRVSGLRIAEQRARWDRRRIRLREQRPLGIVVAGGVYIFEVKDREADLDVPVLHKSLIGGVLGITEEQVRDGKHLRYIRGMDSAIQEVRSGAAQIACLLKPTSVEQVNDNLRARASRISGSIVLPDEAVVTTLSTPPGRPASSRI